ncbi:MAG: RNA-binding cell elongation regulator Jag/EloR [Chloroflexota bacterium]
MPNQNAEGLDVSGKTVDEAIEQGLAKLKLTRAQVDIEIISEGRRGVFGLGAEEARVRLTPRPGKSSAPPAAAAPVRSKQAADLPRPVDKTPPPARVVPVAAASAAGKPKDVEAIATACLLDLLRLMGIRGVQIETGVAADLAEADEEPPLVLNITGRDLGILIGRRSETLRALQYMLRLMVSKQMSSWQPIVVDVESYRVRRRQSLRRMAEKMAERAVASGKRVVLEAMPAYERRLIHVALKDHPQVFTKSIGTDDNRKVTIVPK